MKDAALLRLVLSDMEEVRACHNMLARAENENDKAAIRRARARLSGALDSLELRQRVIQRHVAAQDALHRAIKNSK